MTIYMRRFDKSTLLEMFWTGKTAKSGQPCEAVSIMKAKAFVKTKDLTAYEVAYAAANKQGNMDWWNPKDFK